MSLFLGKIHFWLFNKILWLQELEKEFINIAESEQLDVVKLNKEIKDKYGDKIPNKPLEEIVDTSNIHGWLQERINSAEGKTAAWITTLINNNCDTKEKLEQVYIKQGIMAASKVKDEGVILNSAEDIFNKINDYILDGMPCDRVNEIIYNDKDCIKWTRRISVHKDIWDKENGDIEYFYFLRSLWIKYFVHEMNSEFKYEEESNKIKAIKRK